MSKPLSLFAGYGVELEYMIVDKTTLNILPICDKVLYQLAGRYVNEYSFDKIALSNELVMHVLEFKTNGPNPSLNKLDVDFHLQISAINEILAPLNAQLLPSGAHPWMNPDNEMKIWPHENNEIYRSYNRIFNCHGHGWSNLQSTHLNLPFSNDEEFAKLHTAIRLILPIIPALSASTPIIDSKLTGFVDTRLEFYRSNQRTIPLISGSVIPEAVFSQQEYQDKILTKIYQAIAPYDTQNVLQEEWLNSRGAIARFDRNAIEIRIIDIQECPKADIAILALITAVLKDLIAEKWQTFAKQAAWREEDLLPLFLNAVKVGQSAVITNSDYLQMFGYTANKSCSAAELWQHLLQTVSEDLTSHYPALQHILTHGNLAERIIRSLGKNVTESHQPTQQMLYQVYKQLAKCLASNQLFSG